MAIAPSPPPYPSDITCCNHRIAVPAVSQAFHEYTKYHPETLAQQGKQLDWSQQPEPFKSYPIGQRIDLTPYLSAESSNGDPEKRLLQRLARFLFLSYGVTAKANNIPRPIYFRTAPSAGGLYPAELYLLSHGLPGLPAGIYNYNSRDRLLIRFWDDCDWTQLQAACFQHPLLNTCPLAVVTSAIFFRSAWRYEDRAYRRICLDTGHLLGNVELAANMTGFRATPIGEFCDQLVNDLLMLEDGQETVLSVLPLQDLLAHPSVARYSLEYGPPTHPDLSAAKPDRSTHLDRGDWLAYLHRHTCIAPTELPSSEHGSDENPGDRCQPNDDLEDGDVTEIARPIPQRLRNWAELPPFPEDAAKVLPTGSDKYNFPFCDRLPTDSEPVQWGEMLQTLADTILRRRSTRQFTQQPITREQLNQLLNFAYHPEQYRPQGLDPQPDYFDLSLVETFVVVNHVTGVDSGCYYYAHQSQELRQIRFKAFQEEVHYLCLGQNLGRDAAVTIFHTADLPQAVAKYGDRSYRYLHLDAGHLGQRLNLAAIALGLGASGIAGFFDDLVNEVLGIPPAEAVLYLTTIGQPR